MRRVVFLAVLAATLVPAANASAETAAEKRMAQQIGMHLKQSGQLRDYRVGIQYHDGVVKLVGSVADADQRDIAVQLVEGVKGVSHVDCQLEIEGDGAPAGDGDRHQLAAALDRATQASAQSEASADFEAIPAPIQPPAAFTPSGPMMPRSNARMAPPRTARNNMPMPMQRMPGMMPVRQASANGIHQASGAACQGCETGGMAPGMGGPGMGGPGMGGPGMGGPAPAGFVPHGMGRGPSYDNAQLPNYAWPSYASHPNYAAVTYPQQYSPTAWPYIGPFYPYPQVPLAWRKVSLEWDDGWWFLDFSAHNSSH